MNSKKLKKINRKTQELLLEWLYSLLEPEQRLEVTEDNYTSYLPKDDYVYVDRKMSLNYFTPKYVKKKLKRLVADNPSKDISSYVLSDIK
jgi:hypothetical protein